MVSIDSRTPRSTLTVDCAAAQLIDTKNEGNFLHARKIDSSALQIASMKATQLTPLAHSKITLASELWS